MSRLTDERPRPVVHRIQTAKSPPVDAKRGRFEDALTARIAAAKIRLLEGGLLQEIEWGIPDGEPDIRGRKTFTYTPLAALIEQRPGLDRSAISTGRADDTVLIILDPVAITDEDLLRWGDPPHTYSIKQIDGLVQDKETGMRYASEVIVIR